MKKLCAFIILSAINLVCFAFEPPPASQVFIPTVKAIDANTVEFNINVRPGYYIYRERVKFNFSDNSSAELGRLNLPSGEIKLDKTGKSDEVYGKPVKIIVPVLGLKPGTTQLTAHYQGCAKDGFCYPPQTQNITLEFNQQLALTKANLATPEKVTSVAANPSSPSSDAASNILQQQNIFFIILSFYGFGLLLAFTPCILPMVPVLSGMIIGHGAHLGSRKAFLLSLTYVLSMSLSYAAAGIIIALLGANLQIIFQSFWAVSIFGIIFVLLALSMFGFYDLKLPVGFQSKLASITRSQHGGAYLGVAIMGALSTLILSPCVTAPLVGALGYIAKNGDAVLGGIALFTLSLGMGTPLLLLGSSAGKILPKTGNWMNAVKAFFGVLLLALAIDLFSRIFPPLLTILLWSALLIISGNYLGAFGHNTIGKLNRFWQGLGLMLVIYGILMIVGASMGHTDPLFPLAKKSSSATTLSVGVVNRNPSIHKVRSLKQTLAQLAKAKKAQMPAMLDFYATWCKSCIWMERTTFTDPNVTTLMSNYYVIKVDISKNDDKAAELLKYFNVIAPPTFIFFNQQGEEISAARLVGELNAAEFSKKLKNNLG